MLELTILRPGEPDRVLRLKGGAYQIGRAPDCEILLDDKEVSRQHARLLVDGSRGMVADSGSGNGTFFEGRSVDDLAVGDGDVVEIIPFMLRFRTLHPDGTPTTRLECTEGPNKGQTYALGDEATRIGRAEDADIQLDDPGASRAHAELVRQNGGWVVRDLRSANGLTVNDERRKEARLSSGDSLRIGGTTLRFVQDAAPVVRLAPTVAAPLVQRADRSDRSARLLTSLFVGVVLVTLAIVLFSRSSGGAG